MSPSEKKPTSTRLATAVPGALSAVLLIGAVAFGATSLRPAAEDQAEERAKPASAEAPAKPEFGATVAGLRRNDFTHDPTPKQPAKTEAPKAEPKTEAPVEAKPEATEVAKEEPKPAEQPKQEPTAKPKPAPVETTKPAPTVKPVPAPANPTALVLEAWANDTKAKLSWTPFGGDGFAYYKVVRSADTHIEFPTSGDDAVVGAIGDPNAPWHADKPSCGTPTSYAVFAVGKSNGAYVVLATSNVVTVTTACAPAPEAAKPLAFALNVLPGQGIQLSWEACWNDRFAYYKVVRSGAHGDPRFPLNAGTELIGVIGDPNQTVFVDPAVAAGQSWAYRVVAVKDAGGSYYPLCETPAMSATAQ